MPSPQEKKHVWYSKPGYKTLIDKLTGLRDGPTTTVSQNGHDIHLPPKSPYLYPQISAALRFHQKSRFEVDGKTHN